jgi:hypothetical protein
LYWVLGWVGIAALHRLVHVMGNRPSHGLVQRKAVG